MLTGKQQRSEPLPYTMDSALEDDLITVEDRNDDLGSYAVRIGTLQTTVYIDLGRLLRSDNVKFRTSHSIHTPVQVGPYRTSRWIEDDAAYALHRAIDGLTSYYREAVEKGHTPQESWLVRNA
jgi:hypothetical protein